MLARPADAAPARRPAGAESISRDFCGYAGTAGFFRRSAASFRSVVDEHYARLFEHAPGLDSRAGNLVFTGAADDPETLETLRGHGLSRSGPRGGNGARLAFWPSRRRCASPRAREVLTELVPALLEAFSHSGDADSGLARFRPRAGADAGGGRTFRAAEIATPADAAAFRRSPRWRAAACADHRAAPACARRGDRPGVCRRANG